MSRLLGLQKNIVYGPINSRRLGSSLGLNLLPVAYKMCPFNCAYCQYGYTSRKGYITESDGTDLPTVEEVGRALEEALNDYPSVSYITFSGNGEATLHPKFDEIVDIVKKIKDSLAPQARVAILSNSALVYKPEIRQALAKLDVRFMKLDAGDESTFKRFNRPHKNLSYRAIIDGLKKMKNIHIQALFAGGEWGNYNDRAIEAWVGTIGEIKPIECHIYSIDRPAAEGRLTLLTKVELDRIKKLTFERHSIKVKVF